ncbi:MAG: hypothetical protein M3Y40_06120, partial [Chloroflexota bacterium]|nr:hypothetical protein [Chloroflexota bacterium]
MPPGAGSRSGRAAGDLLSGVVAGAHQRPGLDVLEAHLEPDAPQRHELGRRVVLHQREVLPGRAQVLADGEDVDIGLAQEGHGVDDLVPGLAEPEHDPGLGDHGVEADLPGHRAPMGEDVDRPIPPGAAPHRPLEARDRLDVVIVDVGPRLHDRAD